MVRISPRQITHKLIMFLGFEACTDAEHRAAGERYANLTTNAARDDFVKQNAVRWTEFARLPYFDLVRCVVIDPMHNLLLGMTLSHSRPGLLIDHTNLDRPS